MKSKHTIKKISFPLIVFFLVLLFSLSCKMSQKVDEESSGQVGNIVFPKERPYIKSELDIGRRICQSLKKKRDFFQTLYDRQEKFRFAGTLKDCQGVTTLDSQFDASISNAQALEYSSILSRENYFRDVITDQSAALNDLCVSLATTDNVLNTVKTGSIRYTVNFLIAENFDRYDVRKEVSDGKGGFTTNGAESLSIITQANQAEAKFIGVEKERTRITMCDGKKYQTMKQSWKGALTPF